MMEVVAVYDIKGVCKINIHPGCLWAGVRLRDRTKAIFSENSTTRLITMMFAVLFMITIQFEVKGIHIPNEWTDLALLWPPPFSAASQHLVYLVCLNLESRTSWYLPYFQFMFMWCRFRYQYRFLNNHNNPKPIILYEPCQNPHRICRNRWKRRYKTVSNYKALC